MTKKRRVFSNDFKGKVVLEALKERLTIEELAKKYELLPNQISKWKSEAIKNISLLFESEKKSEPQSLISIDKLYSQIGVLTIENDFLKKKLY